MKLRVLLVLAVALAAIVLPSFGSAETVCTDIGCVSVDEAGYLVVADGTAGNPDPLDGFVSVSSDGQVCSDDNGTADDGDPNNGPESDSPMCNP